MQQYPLISIKPGRLCCSCFSSSSKIKPLSLSHHSAAAYNFFQRLGSVVLKWDILHCRNTAQPHRVAASDWVGTQPYLRSILDGVLPNRMWRLWRWPGLLRWFPSPRKPSPQFILEIISACFILYAHIKQIVKKYIFSGYHPVTPNCCSNKHTSCP